MKVISSWRSKARWHWHILLSLIKYWDSPFRPKVASGWAPGGQVCGYPWQAPAFLPLLPGPKLVTQSHHSLLRMEPRVGPAPLPLPQPLPQISPRHHNNPDLIQVKEFSFSLFHNDSWVLSSWNEKWECPWRDTPRFKTRHYWELETEEQRISVCSVVFIGNFSRIYWF